MLNFKSFLLEYITDEQHARYSGISLTKKAKAATDHFFGPDNHKVTGTLDHMTDKSEIHKKIEQHLGKEISHENYRAGLTQDSYGRPIRIGKVLKDEQLRKDYTRDPSREGAKASQQYTTSTVRGVEVAGQTNPKPNKEHPSGHAWTMSCKNVETGINKHYLKHEIKHGTVVHFVHDHNGKEIYRATLQPHYNKKGHSIYRIDSEYGIKHPEFTESAHEVSKQLSTAKSLDDIFEKHSKVYDDSNIQWAIHPAAPAEHLSHIMDNHKHGNIAKSLRASVITHPNVQDEHITKALTDEHSSIQELAASNPKVKEHHITHALKNSMSYIKREILKHPHVQPHHISIALKDGDTFVRGRATAHPNNNEHTLLMALDHPDQYTRRIAAEHKNATDKVLTKALNDEDPSVRRIAAEHRNAKPEHLEVALNDTDRRTRDKALENPNLNDDQIRRIIKHSDDIRDFFSLSANPSLNQEHIKLIAAHPNKRISSLTHTYD